MDKSREAILANSGHNIAQKEKFIQEKYAEYAETYDISMKQNKKRADIREELKNEGIDPKAFQDQFILAKKKTLKSEKEGYAESASLCWDALNKGNMDSLFAWAKKEEKPAKPEKEKPAGVPSGKGKKDNAEQAAAIAAAHGGKPN
jgi:transposase